MLGPILCGSDKIPEDFAIVAYNLENVFDIDGVSIFKDYRQDLSENPYAYSKEKLLTKLENAARVLKTVNDGAGPEIILIQELEGDFTPESSISDWDSFLGQYSGTTVRTMLSNDWQEDFAGIPAVAWLLKALADAGMTGYSVVVAPTKPFESGVAHVNAVFSRFPIKSFQFYPILEARDIVEVELDIGGHSLWLYNNHWKSGASNPKREPTRIENAKVLRELIDIRLQENPFADIIIGGDLNSHYNQDILFPEIETGINDILGSQGQESFGDADLYNLWYELPPADRFSEVWRGRRGSLMHLLVSPGLYNAEGVSYVDGSFRKLVLAGLNIDSIGRPLEWFPGGITGGGFSDHLPLLARFSTAAFTPKGALSQGDDALDYEMPLSLFDFPDLIDFPDGSFIGTLSDSEIGPYAGKLYAVDATVLQMKPLELKIGDSVWSAYAPNPSLREKDGLPFFLETTEGQVRLVVRMQIFRGKKELVIEKIL